MIKIHLLFKCVRVSLCRPQGTSRGVGALGGGEHSLFFMLWVKTMRVWAGLVIWWKFADFQGTRWGHGAFSACSKPLLFWQNNSRYAVSWMFNLRCNRSRRRLNCQDFLFFPFSASVMSESHLQGNVVKVDCVGVVGAVKQPQDGTLWCSLPVWTSCCWKCTKKWLNLSGCDLPCYFLPLKWTKQWLCYSEWAWEADITTDFPRWTRQIKLYLMYLYTSALNTFLLTNK